MDQVFIDREMIEAAAAILDSNQGIDIDAWDRWDILVLMAAITNELGRREEEESACRH